MLTWWMHRWGRKTRCQSHWINSKRANVSDRKANTDEEEGDEEEGNDTLRSITSLRRWRRQRRATAMERGRERRERERSRWKIHRDTHWRWRWRERDVIRICANWQSIEQNRRVKWKLNYLSLSFDDAYELHLICVCRYPSIRSLRAEDFFSWLNDMLSFFCSLYQDERIYK